MRDIADLVQGFVHALETGWAAKWLRRSVLGVLVFTVALIYIYNFRGLATSQAIDQAQIARGLLNGQGWHTEWARPRALGQLQSKGKSADRVWSDTYNAPLPPVLDAIALLPVKAKVQSPPNEPIYVGDKFIAMLGLACFLASIVVIYFTAERLFDQKLAFLVCGLAVVCGTFWDYAVSGLPQMALLLFFNSTLYFLIRAVEAQYEGGRVGLWLLAVGAGFGVLALTHALTIWIFLATLLFAAFFFRPRFWAAGMALAAFLAIYSPWCLRNFILTGNPAGVAFYSVFDGILHTESGWMRQVGFDPAGIGFGAFRSKLWDGLTGQTGRLVEYFGWSIPALLFFVSLLHSFRKREAAVMRWFLFFAWGGALFGMALYGMKEEDGYSANQLHLLFIPLMSCYGLAYLLVQWNRLNISFPFARIVFILGIFLVSAVQFCLALWDMLMAGGSHLAHWPPYAPPYIGSLSKLMDREEVIATDMPWAVAWYANHRAVWCPDKLQIFAELSDYHVLGGPINALFLTPISGTMNKFGDIFRGEWKEWAPAIERGQSMEKFPLKHGTYLSTDEYLFFSNRDRRGAAGGGP